MPEYRLTSRAEMDLAEVADYTIETFGIEQARRFRGSREKLATGPMRFMEPPRNDVKLRLEVPERIGTIADEKAGTIPRII